MSRRISRVSSFFGRDRLFVPCQLLRFEPLCDALGERDIEEAVAIDHDVHIRTDGIAHRHHARDPAFNRRFDLRWR
jgi:hypothetical protein